MNQSETPPTVLHITSSLGKRGGGTERQLLLYFQNQTGRWRHVIAYRQPHARLGDAIGETGTKTMWLGPGGFFRHVIRVMRLARAESAVLIHTHLPQANAVGRLAGRLLGIPVITTVTNTLEPEDREAAGEFAQPWKYRAALRYEAWTGRWGTDVFIAISQAVADSTMRTLGVSRDRIRLIYRAIEPPTLSSPHPRQAGPVLISTGRLVPHKGHDLLIRMLPGVLKRWPTASLVLVGRGAERARLDALARQVGVADRVRFQEEWVPNIYDLLHAADVFLFASWFDGFIIAIAEAVSAALPIVAVELPVLREIPPPASTVLVPRDEGAFADAVLRVLGDLDRYKAAAREESVRFLERFSVRRYVEGTEALYAEVTGRAVAEPVGQPAEA